MIDSWQAFPDGALWAHHTLAQLTCVFAAVIALLQLGLFWNNRTETHYGWTALAAAGYVVISFSYFMPTPSEEWHLLWRLLLFCAIQAFATGGCVYFLNECGINSRYYLRFASYWSLAFLMLFGGSVAVTGRPLPDAAVLVWNVGLSVASLYPALPLLQLVRRYRNWQHGVFLATYLVVGAAAFLDTSRMFGGMLLAVPIPLLPLMAALWFVAVCFFLVSDFTGSLRAQRQYTARLAQELADQKQELSRLHALERSTHIAKAAAVERSRIMQDMHDGLGSQLVSSLAMARAGELSSTQTYELLRSCIDDLRLAIDTSQYDEDSLPLAMGNLRFRMQPRLKAAGITLHWKTQTLSNPLALGPQLQLPVLRIIQECLTNALKHANAQTITLEATNTDTQFMLTIQDDGGGFDVQAAKEQASGKGLNGLEKRARVLGGTLRVESSPQGTRVELQVPLAMAAM